MNLQDIDLDHTKRSYQTCSSASESLSSEVAPTCSFSTYPALITSETTHGKYVPTKYATVPVSTPRSNTISVFLVPATLPVPAPGDPVYRKPAPATNNAEPIWPPCNETKQLNESLVSTWAEDLLLVVKDIENSLSSK